MNTRNTFSHRQRAQSGVTLIELMVALLLGVLLIGGAVEVFVSNRATYAFNEGFSRVQENGRFALDTLNFHGRLAGYFGCLSDVTRYNDLNTPTKLDFNFDEGIRGYEAIGTAPGQTFAAGAINPTNSVSAGDWAPALPAELVGSVLPGSDVLIVRHASPNSHTLLSPFTTADTVTAVADITDYFLGDIAIVSDCQKASIFQITNVANAAGGIAISHVAPGTPGNLTASWDTDQQYGPGSQLIRAETWVFYAGARPALAGGAPALFQQGLSINSATTTAALVAEELVESVETMQVRYGIDAALDGAIDQYVTADNVANWAQVVAIRVALVMRSPEEYGTEVDDSTYIVDETTFNPIDDRRVRQVFVTTIAVRNRLP